MSAARPGPPPEWTPRMWQGCSFPAWARLLLRNRFAVSPGLAYIPLVVTNASLMPVEGDAVVLCDHDAPDAPQFLRDALASPASYVAMMASRRRAEGLLADLEAEGLPNLEKLHVPAGHDLGGKSPGEIALSVVAEIVAESYDRPGGPMRGPR